jgi:hypothetical protein
MDYSIKNANQHIGNDLLSKARELANNSVRTKGGSFTDAELDQLLQEANRDGKITPEEVRFVAGLTNEHNVQYLSKSNFKPINGQLQFQNISTPRLNKINDQATKINDATKTKNIAQIHQLFSQSGISTREIGSMAQKGLSASKAQELFTQLTSIYGKDLKKIGPQMVALAVLQTASGRKEGLSPNDISQIIDQFKEKAFIRPDGYMTDYLSGKAYDYKVGSPQLQNGNLTVNGIPVGSMYSNKNGVFHAVEKMGNSGDLLELPLQGGIPVLDNVLDGMGQSLGNTLIGVKKLFTTPINETLSGLSQLPKHVAMLIKNSPEYAHRFSAMPFADQQREASKILTDLFFLNAGAKGAVRLANKIKPTNLAKTQMPVVELNGKGQISFSTASVDSAQANQLMASPSSPMAILGEAANRAKFQNYVDELAIGMGKPINIREPELARTINKMYRENADIGSGSTADALRFEIETGVRVGGVEHLQKVNDNINKLERWINKFETEFMKDSGKVSQHDYYVAKHLLVDLKQSLTTKMLPRDEVIAKLQKYLQAHPNGQPITRLSVQQRLQELMKLP